MAGALMVVVVVVAAVFWGADDREANVAAPIGTPQDLLIGFPLDREPVEGWRITPTDVGLPPENGMGDLFASSGNRGYFVAECGHCHVSTAYVYGVDTVNGSSLFPPIELTGPDGEVPTIECFNNGPGVALCLRQMADKSSGLLWVVDLEKGAVTFSGPSDYETGLVVTDKPTLHAIGRVSEESRLVAVVKGKGVYGVGLRGELTWFVPGAGDPLNLPNVAQNDNIPPLTVIAQPALNPSHGAQPPDRMFSVVDGTDVTPDPPKGVRLRRSTVYRDGFAYQFTDDEKNSAGVMFYDTEGKLAGTYKTPHGELPFFGKNAAMPVVLAESQWQIYDAKGRLIIRIPSKAMAGESRMIGDDIYINESNDLLELDDNWHRWNILTGVASGNCNANLRAGYVASDGNVVIARQGFETLGAFDWNSCKTLWTSFYRSAIWQVGRGLIRRNFPNHEIVQLKPAMS